MEVNNLKNTIKIALFVCLFCFILVSTAAIGLKNIQKKNKKLDKIKNILITANLITKNNNDIEKIYKSKIKAILVELKNGQIIKNIKDKNLNPESFDIKSNAESKKYGINIPKKKDFGSIKRKPKYMPVYLVKDTLTKKNKTLKIKEYILPFYGKGARDIIYGFISLKNDLQTISGLSFYDHVETPGLGGEVDNPKWKSQWKGKIALDTNSNVIIKIIKGKVNKSSKEAKYQIDGLSGATFTSRAVEQMLKFWLGDDGYKYFFQKIKNGTI